MFGINTIENHKKNLIDQKRGAFCTSKSFIRVIMMFA